MSKIFLIIVLCFIITLCVSEEYMESFIAYPLPYPLPRVRRNMSYDLRGDLPIPYYGVSPWYQPEVCSILSRPIIMQGGTLSSGN